MRGACKTDSLNLDQTELWPLLSPLRLASQPGGLLWGLTPEEITFQFRPVCRARRLGGLWWHLYYLRPGGAPVNLLTGRHSPAGAWRLGRAAPASRRRYGKERALLDEIARANAMAFTLGVLGEIDRVALLEHSLKRTGRRAPVPPPGPRIWGPPPIAAGRRGLRRPATSVRAAPPSRLAS